jgi:hypothetical protein
MEGPEAPARGGAAPWLVALAALASGVAAALILTGRSVLAGAAVAVAGGALVFADVRASGRQRFAHGVVERAVDGVVLGAVAWVAVVPTGAAVDAAPEPIISAAALSALGFAYLAAYVRAKGRGLGFEVSDPVLERPLHFALVSASLLFDQASLLLWLAAAVDAQAVLRMAASVGRQREA